MKHMQNILKSILEILKQNKEHFWCKKIDNLYKKSLTIQDIEKAHFISNIEHLYGGMGSFSDLVLHRNGTPLIQENAQLDSLKNDLYSECIKIRKML